MVLLKEKWARRNSLSPWYQLLCSLKSWDVILHSCIILLFRSGLCPLQHRGDLMFVITLIVVYSKLDLPWPIISDFKAKLHWKCFQLWMLSIHLWLLDRVVSTELLGVGLWAWACHVKLQGLPLAIPGLVKVLPVASMCRGHASVAGGGYVIVGFEDVAMKCNRCNSFNTILIGGFTFWSNHLQFFLKNCPSAPFKH